MLGIVLQHLLSIRKSLVLKTRCAARTKTPADQPQMMPSFIRGEASRRFQTEELRGPVWSVLSLPPVFWSAEETLAASGYPQLRVGHDLGWGTLNRSRNPAVPLRKTCKLDLVRNRLCNDDPAFDDMLFPNVSRPVVCHKLGQSSD